jgi:peptidoglycan/xylan/chitin deacetylase (PgdA/CDA1 family)
MFSVEKFYRRFIDKILSWFTDAICCVSNEIFNVTQYKSFITSKKLLVLYSGLEMEKYKEAHDIHNMQLEVREKRGFPPRVIIVGAIEPRKDHKCFINAACKLLDEGLEAEFYIVGDGPLRSEMESLVKNAKHEDKIIFTGVRSDVADLLSESSVYVSSSITEGVSLALLEAMAVGVPVVATAVGGTCEVAKGSKSIMLVEPQNPDALAGGITAMLECAGAGKVIAEDAHKIVVRRFNSKYSNERLLGIYRHLIAEKIDHKGTRKIITRSARYLASRITFMQQSLPREGEVRILMYHRIRNGFLEDRLSVSTMSFIQQLKALADSGVPVLRLDKALELQKQNKLSQGAFCITFDDGYLDTYKNARIIMNDFMFEGTVYLPAMLIDSGSMISRYAGDENPEKLMGWKDAGELLEDGWEIGSHSMTHSDLCDMDEELLKTEIFDSAKLITEKLTVKPKSFAYPRGVLSAQCIKIIKRSVYKNAVTVWPGINTPDSPKHLLSRTEISGDDSLADFSCKIKGGFDMYQRYIQRGTKYCTENFVE